MKKNNKFFIFMYSLSFLFFFYNLNQYTILKSNVYFLKFYINKNKSKNNLFVKEKEIEEIKIIGVCYINENNWRIWTQNHLFTNNNKKIENIEVIEISLKFIILKKNEEIIKIHY